MMKLATQGPLHKISSPRGQRVASHVFYADDLSIFCKVEIRGLKALIVLFDKYEEASRQFISKGKRVKLFLRNT